jgi:hypothetical protein
MQTNQNARVPDFHSLGKDVAGVNTLRDDHITGHSKTVQYLYKQIRMIQIWPLVLPGSR